MKKVLTLLVTLALAATLTLAAAVSAHEDNEAEEASSEHFLGVNWDAPWMSRVLVIGSLAVVGVSIYGMQRR
jgi:NADH:ubiquinone oxidoreductase subunit 2 (subunit N)